MPCCSQDVEEHIAISAATNGDRLMAEEEQAAAKAAAKKAKRLKQKARSKEKQAAAQILSGQHAPLTGVEKGKQQQPAAEPLHDEFSHLLAKFVARSDPTSAVATQAEAAVMPTHGVATSSQHQAESSAGLAAAPCVQAQASPSAHPELSSNPEANRNPETSSNEPRARSSVHIDGRDDFLNALLRCPITKVRCSEAVHPIYNMAFMLRAQHTVTSPSQACHGQPNMLYQMASNSGAAAFAQSSAQSIRSLSYLVLV